MPQWTVQSGGGNSDNLGAVPATSLMTAMTCGAANVKGAWAQLVASTPHTLSGLLVFLRGSSAAARFSVDVGIGAAAAEIVVLPDIMHSDNSNAAVVFFPCQIPKGARISVRGQSATAALTALACIIGIPSTNDLERGCSAWQNIGFTAATTRGALLDGGGVANTDSAWVQLTASLPKAAKWLICCFCDATAVAANTDLLVDIGVGAAAAEQILISDIPVHSRNVERSSPQLVGPFAVDLPAGTRISARVRASGIDAGGRTQDIVCLLGG